ncbi:MAG: YHYH protein [Actinomycetales bacterium]|nr:YHYH protein [Actinomycetales bacterium]
MGRRAFLIGSLGAALTVTAAGTTGLLARSAWADETTVLDAMGDYTITDRSTGCQVTVTVRNGVRRIRANGLPNHRTGQFANAHNPNTISSQSYDYRLPAHPKRSSTVTPYSLPQPFGIALNGVIFDPLAAEWFNRDPSSGWTVNPLGGAMDLGLDANEAHVQPNGAYHYHGIPQGLVAQLSHRRHSPLIGWAGDGFPIYLDRGHRKARNAASGITRLRSSYRLKSGPRPGGPGGRYNGDYLEDYEYVAGLGDLDAANGRYQVTPEYPRGTYAYILTAAYPVIPHAFAAPVATSFVRAGGAGGGRPGGPPPRPQ